MNCKYCQSENVIKYGKYKDTQYYYCKDCKRKFSNPDAIPKMQYSISKVADVLNMYYEGIAHGRVFLDSPDGINRLLRFKKPNKNGVVVEFSVAMTEEWFTTQFLRFFDAVRTVDAVHKRQDSEKVNNLEVEG